MTVTGVIELGTGLGLLIVPGIVVGFLLGTNLETPTEAVICRILGAALCSIGAACLIFRRGGDDGVAARFAAVLLYYDLAAAGVLAHAGGVLGLSGYGLWPAVILHLGMAGWCGTKIGSNVAK